MHLIKYKKYRVRILRSQIRPARSVYDLYFIRAAVDDDGYVYLAFADSRRPCAIFYNFFCRMEDFVIECI